MKNTSVMTLEIFSSSKLFLRTPYMVEFMDYECFQYSKFYWNFESTSSELSHHLYYGHTASRKAYQGSRMISGIYSSDEYSHSFFQEKIKIFSYNIEIFFRKILFYFLFHFVLKYFIFLYECLDFLLYIISVEFFELCVYNFLLYVCT